jgi:hypothetical protein
MMKIKTVDIDPDMADILRRSKCEGNCLTLPEQLERRQYDAVSKRIALLGGKWNRSKKCHVFENETDIGKLIGDALDAGEIVDTKKTFQHFDTPLAVGERVGRAVARHAAFFEGARYMILEPSAGRGNLISVVLRCLPKGHSANILPTIVVDAVEIQQELIGSFNQTMQPYSDHASDEAYAYGVDVFISIKCADFLTIDNHAPSRRKYNAIVMNPPFCDGQEALHVMHALDFLAPGGVLVSVVSAAVQFKETRPYRQLREVMDNYNHSFEELPEASFKEAGTKVRTQLLIVTL